MKNTISRLFGVATLLRSSFLIALWSSASIAATVNVTTSNPTLAIGEPYTVTVSGIDFPETAGAVLGLRYDASVVDITGVMLASGSPFTGGVVVSPSLDPPSFPDPLEWIAVLGPNFGPNPSGSFDAFVIQATAIAPGDATIKLVDNQSTNCWADVSTSDCVKPITYCYIGNGCEEVPTIPISASVWLFGSAVAALGWIRRKVRRAATGGHALASFMAAMFCIAATPAWGYSYALTDLGSLRGGSSTATGINNNGQVVGYSATGFPRIHAFIYSNGVMTDLGSFKGILGESFGADINDNGQAVGRSEGNFFPVAFNPFLYSNGVMTNLGNLGGNAGAAATAINNSGQVVGFSHVALSGEPHAFLYSNGSMTDLCYSPCMGSVALDINDTGQVVGEAKFTGNATSHAFIYSNGVMTDLGSFGGASVAFGMNDNGQIVGSSTVGTEFAFLYSDGTMSNLGTLGGATSRALAINESGQVVGFAETASKAFHAFVYNGDSLLDLNDMVSSGGAGWLLQEATDINDLGQIVGQGSHNGFLRAFLLTPVPLPAAAWLLASALGVLTWARRRVMRG